MIPLTLKDSALVRETWMGGESIASRPPIPDNPWDFMTKCVLTVDELAERKGLSSVRPFPSYDYLRIITEAWQSERQLRIEKSRQIMLTWLMAGLHLWAALAKRGERIAFVCRKFDVANDHLKDRFWFIYQNIPSIYAKPRARFLQGSIEVFHDDGDVPTSRIMAISEGVHQLRSYTFSRILWDEMAFSDDQEETYGAMQPTLAGMGQVTIVSSANGDRNLFYELGHKEVRA
jgi:phage FluMu gp28-like protein